MIWLSTLIYTQMKLLKYNSFCNSFNTLEKLTLLMKQKNKNKYLLAHVRKHFTNAWTLKKHRNWLLIRYTCRTKMSYDQTLDITIHIQWQLIEIVSDLSHTTQTIQNVTCNLKIQGGD